MTLKKYQDFVGTTAVFPDNEKWVVDLYLAQLLYLGSKLAEEAGEVSGKIGKAFRDSCYVDEDGVLKIKPIDKLELRNTLIKELGDAQWYITMIAKKFGISLEDIMKENERKLTDRFERGVIKGSGDNR